NIPEFLYLYYACARIGLLPVLALPPHRWSEISYLARFSEAAAYVVPATFRGFDYRQLAREVRQAERGLRLVLVAGPAGGDGQVSLDELLRDPIEERQPAEVLAALRPDPSDVALFLL